MKQTHKTDIKVGKLTSKSLRASIHNWRRSSAAAANNPTVSSVVTWRWLMLSQGEACCVEAKIIPIFVRDISCGTTTAFKNWMKIQDAIYQRHDAMPPSWCMHWRFSRSRHSHRGWKCWNPWRKSCADGHISGQMATWFLTCLIATCDHLTWGSFHFIHLTLFNMIGHYWTTSFFWNRHYPHFSWPVVLKQQQTTEKGMMKSNPKKQHRVKIWFSWE